MPAGQTDRSQLATDPGMAARDAGDAHQQARQVRTGATSAVQLVQQAIQSAEALNPAINALSHRHFDEACERAASLPPDAPMPGVPYLVKDSLGYKGMPSKCGSQLLAKAPAETTQFPLADRLDAAGLVPIGKSTVPEFSLLPTTESALYGETRNPWNPIRSAGGSSGGAAAAVASGIVPIAHGSDGGGSIRIPASCCALVGLKPSRGANVKAREFHLIEDILVGDGMLTRTVRDAAFFARLLRPDTAMQQPVKSRFRIVLCLSDTTGAQPHPEIADIVLRCGRLCQELGHEVTQFERLPGPAELTVPTFRTLWFYLALDLAEGLHKRMPGIDIESKLEPWAAGLARAARGLHPHALAAAYGAIGVIGDAMKRFYETFDILLSPVTREPPPPLGRLSPARDFRSLAEDVFSYVGYTPLANLAGLPSLSVPLYISASGLPAGVMLTAGSGGDEQLLALATQLEAACPWSQRWPTLATV